MKTLKEKMYYCVVDSKILILEKTVTSSGNIAFFRHWASGGKSEIFSEIEFHTKDRHELEEKFPEYFI